MQKRDAIGEEWRWVFSHYDFAQTLQITERGLILGAGTPLIRFADMPSGRRLDATRDHDRFAVLAAIAFDQTVLRRLVSVAKKAAAICASGDLSLANIFLAQARLPRLRSWHDGYKVFLAERALALGETPDGLISALDLPASLRTVLKYPGQPHVPAGNGRASGQFGSGQEGGTKPTPVFLEPMIDVLIKPGPLGTAPSAIPFGPDPHPDPRTQAPQTKPTPPSTDDDASPRACPAPVSDKGHGASDRAKRYEIDGHREVNPGNPLEGGQAIYYKGIYFDDCARTDDPKGRWKVGDLIEFKGPRYDYLLGRPYFAARGNLFDEAGTRDAVLVGTGRKVVYLFAEAGARDQANDIFDTLPRVKAVHFPPSSSQKFQ